MNWKTEFDNMVFINGIPHRDGEPVPIDEYRLICEAALKDGYSLPLLIPEPPKERKLKDGD